MQPPTKSLRPARKAAGSILTSHGDPPIYKLPRELLDLVLEMLPQSTLAVVVRVNRQLADIGRLHLYRNINIGSVDCLLSLLRVYFLRPYVRDYSRRLKIRFSHVDLFQQGDKTGDHSQRSLHVLRDARIFVDKDSLAGRTGMALQLAHIRVHDCEMVEPGVGHLILDNKVQRGGARLGCIVAAVMLLCDRLEALDIQGESRLYHYIDMIGDCISRWQEKSDKLGSSAALAPLRLKTLNLHCEAHSNYSQSLMHFLRLKTLVNVRLENAYLGDLLGSGDRERETFPWVRDLALVDNRETTAELATVVRAFPRLRRFVADEPREDEAELEALFGPGYDSAGAAGPTGDDVGGPMPDNPLDDGLVRHLSGTLNVLDLSRERRHYTEVNTISEPLRMLRRLAELPQLRHLALNLTSLMVSSERELVAANHSYSSSSSSSSSSSPPPPLPTQHHQGATQHYPHDAAHVASSSAASELLAEHNTTWQQHQLQYGDDIDFSSEPSGFARLLPPSLEVLRLNEYWPDCPHCGGRERADSTHRSGRFRATVTRIIDELLVAATTGAGRTDGSGLRRSTRIKNRHSSSPSSPSSPPSSTPTPGGVGSLPKLRRIELLFGTDSDSSSNPTKRSFPGPWIAKNGTRLSRAGFNVRMGLADSQDNAYERKLLVLIERNGHDASDDGKTCQFLNAVWLKESTEVKKKRKR